MVRFIAALAGYGEAGALGARDRDEATIAYWAAPPTGHYRELHIIHHAADAFATRSARKTAMRRSTPRSFSSCSALRARRACRRFALREISRTSFPRRAWARSVLLECDGSETWRAPR